MKLFTFIFLLSFNVLASVYVNCGNPNSPVELTIQLHKNNKGNMILSTPKGKTFLSITSSRTDHLKIEYKTEKNNIRYSIAFDKRVLKTSSDYFSSDLYVETATRIHREQLNCYSKLFY